MAAQVLHRSILRKRDDTQSAARGDRLADGPQLSCVRKPRTLKIRCSWAQYTSESHSFQGRKLTVEYFGETYPVEVAGVGYKPLYDPENLKPRS